VAALEPGRTSWTLPLDAVRLGPADDATEVTAAQVRDVARRIIAAGHWRDGDPDILVVFDAGYDLTRLAWLLRDLPAEVPGRRRSDRVMYLPAPPRLPGTNGRPLRHGAALKPADERSWPAPAAATVTQASRYGTARAAAWGQTHQRLACRAGWEDHDGELPVIEGTSSGWLPITCQATAARNPCGYGPRPRAPLRSSSTPPGRRSRAASTRTHVQVLQAGARLDPAQAA
jgi:hypothetical protein